MKMPRFLRRWRHQRDKMRKSSLPGFWKSLVFPFRRGWKWLSEARTKRSYQNLWWGLPAVLLAVIAVTLGVVASVKASGNSAEYRRLAMKSYREGDFESARVYLERVYRDGDTGNDVTFFLASTLDGQGETQRANAMIESLSPEDSVGYPEAHLLKAKVLLAPEVFQTKPQALRAFHHLDAAKSKFQNDAEWLSMSGKFHLMIGEPEEAVRYLREAARLDPNLLFQVGMVYQKLGRKEDAREQLELARKHYASVLSSDSRNHAVRLNLGSILAEQGNFGAASTILTEGLSLDKEAGFDKALARVCMAQYRLLLSSPDTQPGLRLKLLRTAIRYDRENSEAVRLLAFFGEEAESTPETRQKASEYLEALVSTGQESPIAHLALGSKAWQAGDKQQAAFHLQRAYKVDPSMAVLANNLAWVLAHQDQPDLDQALAIMNTVLEDHPNIPDSRDTRGQILTKMGKWDEALDDLEFALRTLPKVPQIHAALYTVYMSMSPPQSKLAENHQRLEKALRAAMPR